MSVALLLLLCASVILVAGTNLSRYGDVIAEKSGVGRTWMGTILLASVTSLPELVTGISSVTIFNVPNIAVGDILGSCMFNMLLIGVVDTFCRTGPASSNVQRGHILSAAFGVLLLVNISVAIVAGGRVPSLGWVGISSLITIGVYLLAMRLIFVEQVRRPTADTGVSELIYTDVPARKAYVLYGVNAIIVVVAATFLPFLADELATLTGLGTTVVGNIVVALATSLPEIVVTISAVRLGALDMAYGNLLGSNLFNVAILAIDDIFYRRGELLASIASSQLVVSFAAMAMMTVVIIGVAYRTPKKRLPIAWDALGIVAIYVFSLALLIMLS